jgi:hypothetical protein
MTTTIGLLLAMLVAGQPEGSAPAAGADAPAATSPERPDLPPAAPAPADPLALRPRKVTDLQGVEQLSLLDLELRRRHDVLASRRAGAGIAFGGAVAGSVVAGIMVFFERVKSDLAGPAACAVVTGVYGQANLTCKPASPNYTPALVTLGVSAALVGVGVALLPRSSDVAGAVALWNDRHPEAPVEGPAPATTTTAPAAETSSGVYAAPGW